MEKIAIVGAGLVGSLWAAYMAKRGYAVDVYERRPDMRKTTISAGRSINLALSNRGWRALNVVDMEKAVREIAIPMPGRMIHEENGEKKFMPYGKGDQAIFSVSRGDLNMLLMDKAEEKDNIHFFFNQRCLDVNLEESTLYFLDETSNKKIQKKYDLIFGTDGAFSAIRTSMMKTDRFNYSQFYLEHGYKELSIPPGETEKWQIDKNALHIWPRKSFMLIALPNLDGSFTVTLFLAFEGEVSFEKLVTDDDVKAFFRKYFPDALEVMPTLIDDWHFNPTSSLVTVRCSPWHYNNNTLIFGDASHAIVPFYGQGMNAGFEDCRIIDEVIDMFDGNWPDILKYVSKHRIKDGNAISELALQNFIEMRDLVADPHFVKKRNLSRKINDIMPEEWIPLYSMVTFSHMPYSEALSRGKKQDLILEQLISNYNYDDLMKAPDLKAIVRKYF